MVLMILLDGMGPWTTISGNVLHNSIPCVSTPCRMGGVLHVGCKNMPHSNACGLNTHTYTYMRTQLGNNK